ncbi:MAG: HNH endonuclease [Nanoarchaeota archaeon]|nr:HNH endonuclease [Nanoarchaeota archaeon]
MKKNVRVNNEPYNFPVQGSASSFAEECKDYLLKALKEKQTVALKEEDVQYIPPEIKEDISNDYEASKEIDQIPKEKQTEYINKKIEELSKEAGEITEPKERLIKHKQRFNKLKPYIKKKFDNKCQFCDYTFIQKNGQHYSEVCHIIPWSKSHDDSQENLIVFCPNHHKEFDLGDKKRRQEIILKLKEKFPDINYKFE